jgi:hypothetical protein
MSSMRTILHSIRLIAHNATVTVPQPRVARGPIFMLTSLLLVPMANPSLHSLVNLQSNLLVSERQLSQVIMDKQGLLL